MPNEEDSRVHQSGYSHLLPGNQEDYSSELSSDLGSSYPDDSNENYSSMSEGSESSESHRNDMFSYS